MFVYLIDDITRNLQSTVATSATQGGTIYRRVKLGYIAATHGAQQLITAPA